MSQQVSSAEVKTELLMRLRDKADHQRKFEEASSDFKYYDEQLMIATKAHNANGILKMQEARTKASNDMKKYIEAVAADNSQISNLSHR
jgi:hypothetical protein